MQFEIGDCRGEGGSRCQGWWGGASGESKNQDIEANIYINDVYPDIKVIVVSESLKPQVAVTGILVKPDHLVHLVDNRCVVDKINFYSFFYKIIIWQ